MTTDTARSQGIESKRIITPPESDVFKSLKAAYTYHDANGVMQFSNDIQLCNPQILELEEQFVTRVTNFDSVAYLIERTMKGIHVKVADKYLAELGDQMLKLRRVSTPPPHHEISEYSTLLSHVTNELQWNPDKINGIPEAVIGRDSYCEAELTNSLVTGVREAAKNTDFEEKQRARKNQVINSCRETEQHIISCFVKARCLCAHRKTLYIDWPSPNGAEGSITLQESDRYFQCFLDNLKTEWSRTTPILGWWWKREYMTETNYRYHLVVFFNEYIGWSYPTDQTIRDAWSFATGNRGIISEHFAHPPQYDERGVGSVFIGKGFDINREDLLLSLKSMLMNDLYLKLENGDAYPHYGMDFGYDHLDAISRSPL